MPPPVRFRTREIAQLWEETRFAPARTRARMMQDAEAFAAEIDPAAGYPPALVVERVTRYRPEHAGAADALVGAAIVADLAAFVLRASREEPLDAAARGGALAAADAARLLGVAERSLARYRSEGLFMHHARFPDGRVRVACFADALERFRARSGSRLERAARTARISDEDRRVLGARATELAAQGGATLHALATTLAPTVGRSVRAVRTALEANDAVRLALAHGKESPVDPGGGASRLSAAQVAYAARALALGHAPECIARRLGAPEATVQRAALRARGGALRAVLADVQPLELPIFTLADAESAVLAPLAVREGLPSGALAMPTPRALGEAAPRMGAPRQADPGAPRGVRGGHGTDPGLAMVVAHHFLVRRAKAAAAGLGRAPSLAEIDGIERDLRWAYRLKRALVEQALPAALACCVQHIGRPWATVPEAMQRGWSCLAIAEAAHALEFAQLSVASLEDVRPVRAVAHWIERTLAREGADFAPPPMADPQALDAAIVRIVPWWRQVSAFDGLRGAALRVAGEDGQLLRARFGFDGAPPQSYAELARRLRTSAPAACAHGYAAMQALREAAAAGAGG